MSNLNMLFELLSYSGSNTNIPADAIKISAKIDDSKIVGTSRVQTQLANGASNVTVNVLAGEYLAIMTDRDITAKLNGGTDVIALSPRANGVKTLVLFYKGVVSSLSLSNSSGDVANIDIFTADR